jgi:hypothetical protein
MQLAEACADEVEALFYEGLENDDDPPVEPWVIILNLLEHIELRVLNQIALRNHN